MTSSAGKVRAPTIPPEFLRDVEMLSQMQAETSEIAAALDMREDEFHALVKTNLKIRKAIRHGRALGIIAVRKLLMKRCHTHGRTCIMMSKKYLGQR